MYTVAVVGMHGGQVRSVVGAVVVLVWVGPVPVGTIAMSRVNSGPAGLSWPSEPAAPPAPRFDGLLDQGIVEGERRHVIDLHRVQIGPRVLG